MVVKDEVLVPRLFIGHLIHLLSTIEDTERRPFNFEIYFFHLIIYLFYRVSLTAGYYEEIRHRFIGLLTAGCSKDIRRRITGFTAGSLNCGVFDDLRRRLANSPIKIRANSSTKENEAGNTLATREDDSTSCGGWISCWLITLIL